MKTVEPKIELVKQPQGLDGMYKQIELAGRLSYKSEDKITETSAKEFVDRMAKMGHGGVLEHGTVYLKVPMNIVTNSLAESCWEYLNKNPYTKISVDSNYYYYTTNYRVLLQGSSTTWEQAVKNNYLYNFLDCLKYFCEPTEYHEKRIAVRFILGIDISREFNRHRVNSMLEQSTRYCNFSKDKFGNELNIMQPREISQHDIQTSLNVFADGNQAFAFKCMCDTIGSGAGYTFSIVDTWLFAHLACEWSYMRLIKLGWKSEQARKVLNLDTQSELIHTAFVSDWKHFLGLRSPKYGAHGAHPDAAYLADMVYDKFKEENIL